MKVAVITDTHYDVRKTVQDSTLWHRQLMTRTPELAERLADRLRRESVDLIFHCGDLTHDGDSPSNQFGMKLLNSLQVPVLMTIGNHDTLEQTSRSELFSNCPNHTACWGSRLDTGAATFITFDSSVGYDAKGGEHLVWDWRRAGTQFVGIGPSSRTLQWLEEQFEEAGDRPIVVASHYPVAGKDRYPVRVPREPSNVSGRLAKPDERLFAHRRQELLTLFQKYPVRAVFGGHWHINDVYAAGRTAFVQTASLIEYPFEFRVGEIKGGELIVRTVGIGDEALDEASFVREWNNQWVRGEPGDREFSLRLKT